MIDPSGRAQAATIAVVLWAVGDVAFGVGGLWTVAALDPGAIGFSASPELADRISLITSVPALVTTLITAVLVSRWIMRVNANAQLVSDHVTITPAWNIGWFFVPIATLWKPFEGVRQSWQASVDPADPGNVPVPNLMRWWWGLWLASSIIGNISFRLSLDGNRDTLVMASWLNAAVILVDIPLAWALIQMMQRFSEVQREARDPSGVFA
jgi:Domain of unknown function (DUF4328)